MSSRRDDEGYEGQGREAASRDKERAVKNEETSTALGSQVEREGGRTPREDYKQDRSAL